MAAGAALAQQATETMGEVAPPSEAAAAVEPHGARPVLGPRQSRGVLQDHGQRETNTPPPPPPPGPPQHEVMMGMMTIAR
jgi:hypothetical protein